MSTRESGKDRVACRVSGTDAVTKASSAARRFGEAQWLTEDEVARLCIIVEELVTNLYDHGGVGHGDAVKLSLASEPGGIRIIIEDKGAPFDPRQPRQKKDEITERGGGAGIDIVRSWAVITAYETSGSGNRLELVMPLAI